MSSPLLAVGLCGLEGCRLCPGLQATSSHDKPATGTVAANLKRFLPHGTHGTLSSRLALVSLRTERTLRTTNALRAGRSVETLRSLNTRWTGVTRRTHGSRLAWETVSSILSILSGRALLSAGTVGVLLSDDLLTEILVVPLEELLHLGVSVVLHSLELLNAILGALDTLGVLLHEPLELLDARLVGIIHLLEDLLEEHLVTSLGANTTRALQAARWARGRPLHGDGSSEADHSGRLRGRRRHSLDLHVLDRNRGRGRQVDGSIHSKSRGSFSELLLLAVLHAELLGLGSGDWGQLLPLLGLSLNELSGSAGGGSDKDESYHSQA
mmetsp:Transcript_47629/g.74361  ORF Transcript_47629/g.74361 Transcript_47629/m.74361 type:complete len:325 (+) Transcript_47629:499-1473(+)